jgi:glycosyltransferase involved in cell wall biosynthesis
LAFAGKSAGADEFSEIESLLTSGMKIPRSYQHYVLAAEFCKNKLVLELDCRGGFGTMILSGAAAKCTGVDNDFESIKFALRNCHVEGKTKFAVMNDRAINFSDYDVVVSFNDNSSSPKEIYERIGTSLASMKQSAVHDLTLIIGFDATGGDVSSATKALGDALLHDYKLYLQTANGIESFSIHDAPTELTDAIRVIAAIDFNIGESGSIKSIRERTTYDLVSIVIPTYNRADLISESIDSAINQTYQDIEIIVVDDGSKDHTRQVISKYGSKVRYFYKENGGIGSALNLGISNMNGKWFKWLSSDDILIPNAVELLVAHAEETGALITYTDYDIIDNEHNIVKTFVEPHFGSYYEFASALWARFIGNGSSSLIERSCIDDVGRFDETLRSAEDYDWWLRACLLHGHRFFHLSESTLKYRMHESQLTSAVKHNAFVTAEKIRDSIREKIISINPKWWQTLASYQKLYDKQNQKGGFARRLLRKSLVYMPEGIRKNALKTWESSVKPKMESAK